MLNDSYWREIEIDNGKFAFLSSNPYAQVIAYAVNDGNSWHCEILPELIKGTLYYDGALSIEEVEWQVTLYINKQCIVLANELCKIRDHLPSIHYLADRAGIGNWGDVSGGEND